MEYQSHRRENEILTRPYSLSHVGLNPVYIFTPCPKSILTLSSHLDAGIPSSLILLGLPNKILY
jgi:hypothetical protein